GIHGQSGAALAHKVKAEWVSKFAQFTEWPEGTFTGNSPLRIGVLGSAEVVATIRQVLANKTISDRRVEVLAPSTASDWESLHILYVTASSTLGPAELAVRLKTPALLTVGDAPDFAERGGALAFFERDGKVRVRINP